MNRGMPELVWGAVGGGLAWVMSAPGWAIVLAAIGGATIGGLQTRLIRLEATVEDRDLQGRLDYLEKRLAERDRR